MLVNACQRMKGVPVHLCYRTRDINERMAFLADSSCLLMRQLEVLRTARFCDLFITQLESSQRSRDNNLRLHRHESQGE